MSKKRRNNEIDCYLRDYENKEVILLKSVLKKHIWSSCHDESFQYYETLKANFRNPNIVIQSRSNKNSKHIIIELRNRKHKYLVVTVKYNGIIERMIGNKNYIQTFYPINSLKQGVTIWKK